MNKILWLVLLLLASQATIFAQNITIIDKEDLQPIANVLITGGKIKTSVTTNLNGKADISRFMNCDSLRFSHINYADASISLKSLATQHYTISLNELQLSLNEIIVSASKFEEKLKDVAQPIHLIKAKELAFINQSTTADVLQNTGQTFVQKSQMGGGSPIIRGFEASKVLMVIDGVRLNNAIYRSGHLQNILSVDNNTLDRLELVLGPGSVVYGSDALGGVMHMHTKSPILSSDSNTFAKAQLFMRIGSANDENTNHVDFNIGTEKIASYTSFTFSDFGDLRQGNNRNPMNGDWGKCFFYVEREKNKDVIKHGNPNIQRATGYKQYDIIEKILYKPNNSFSHVLNIQYSTSSDIPRYDRLSLLSGSNPKFAEWYYGPQKRLLTAYTFSVTKPSLFYNQAKFIVAYQNIEESRQDRRFNKDILNNQIEKLDIMTFNADFEKKIKKHELRYGIDASHNDVNSTAYAVNITDNSQSPISTRYPDGGSTMTSYAGYITHTLEFNEKFIMNDGIRISHTNLTAMFNDKSFFPFPFDDINQTNSALNGSLGFIYMPGRDWRFSLLGSSGYRAPNVDDLTKVFESIPGMITVPNPNIKPEYTYNADFGISKVFNKDISISANAFYCIYTNAITTGLGTFNGKDSIDYQGQLSQVVTSVNAGEAYIYGISGNISIILNKNTTLNSSINYTYGRIVTDSSDLPLDHVAPVFGKTSIVWSQNKFKSEFYVLYNGWKRLADYNMYGEDNFTQATPMGTPAWYTLNSRASYQVNKNFQLQVAIENILDQNYRVFASGISAPGRNVLMTVRCNL